MNELSGYNYAADLTSVYDKSMQVITLSLPWQYYNYTVKPPNKQFILWVELLSKFYRLLIKLAEFYRSSINSSRALSHNDSIAAKQIIPLIIIYGEWSIIMIRSKKPWCFVAFQDRLQVATIYITIHRGLNYTVSLAAHE